MTPDVNAIFVLEDQPEVCDALRLVLEPEVFRLTHCFEPADVLAALKKSIPCTIIADFCLREGDASGLIRQLKEMDLSSHIVLMSGIVNLIDKSKELGVNYWIQKPFELDRLVRLLRWLRMQCQAGMK